MDKRFLLFRITFFSSVVLSVGFTEDACKLSDDGGHSMNVSVFVTKNAIGEWHTTFNATKSVADAVQGVHLDIKQFVVKCNSKQVVTVRGILTDMPKSEVGAVNKEKPSSSLNQCNEVGGKFKFSEMKGKHVTLLNDGRTAYRNPVNDLWAGLVSNRRLADDELFEVIFDKCDHSSSSTVAFGLMVDPPSDVASQRYLFSYGNSWALLSGHVQNRGNSVTVNYPLSLVNLNEGTRIGIMRRSNGNLHYFHNGVDKGVAATNVPACSYVIFDLIHYAQKISITT